MAMDLASIEDMFDNAEDDDGSDNDDVRPFNNVWKTFPQRKRCSVMKSLRILAIENICDNISHWMDYLPENALRCLYVISPFDKLRTVDTLDILKKLVEMKIFQQKHLSLIFHQNLTEMDLGLLSRYNLTDIHLNTILNRCKKIKRLRIPSRSNFNAATVSKIPTVYPKLEELLLYTYSLDYQFLRTLTENCLELKSVHLSATIMLNSKVCNDLNLCPAIKSLSLHGLENITAKETWKILSTLPKLKNLSLHQSTLKFSTLNGSASLLPNITGLDLSASSISDRGVAAIVSSVSNIINLNLSNCVFLTSIAFKYIEKLKKLVSLRMCYLCYHCEFDSNVESCLMKIGKELTLLDLSGLRNIKTSVIGSCCPNLSVLSLNECLISSLEWIPCLDRGAEQFLSLSGACPKLRKLHFANVNMDMNAGHLEKLNKLFRGCNNLQEFKLSSDSFNYEIFKTLFKSFEWKYLEVLDFSGNQRGITLNIVVYALQSTPKLSTLCIRNCNLMSEEKREIKRLMELSKIIIDVKF